MAKAKSKSDDQVGADDAPEPLTQAEVDEQVAAAARMHERLKRVQSGALPAGPDAALWAEYQAALAHVETLRGRPGKDAELHRMHYVIADYERELGIRQMPKDRAK